MSAGARSSASRGPRPVLAAGLAAFALVALAFLAPATLAAQGWRERLRLPRLGTAEHPVTLWTEITTAEHRVTLDGAVEQASGSLLGVEAEVGATPWLDLRLAARGGALSADWAPSEDRRMGEIALAADVFPLPSLGVVTTATVRGYRADLGSQRWTMLSVGPEGRLALYGDQVTGRVRLAAAPIVRVSGTSAPVRALEGSAEVTYERGRLRAALDYGLERYDFERGAETRRLEQLGRLSFRVGWRFGG